MGYLIVFDLDGTLIDSRLDLAESANELLESYGRGPLRVDVVVGMVGDGARALVERVLQAGGLGGIDVDLDTMLGQFLEIYDRRLLVHTRPYPGIVGAVRAVQERAALAVLTNKPVHHTERLLQSFALRSSFRWVVGGDSGLPRKPDPASLRHLMLEAQTPPERTLMVGDSMVDVETGRRAGVRICVAGYGFAQFREGLDVRGDEWIAATPADLEPRLLEFLGARGTALG